MIRYSSYTCGDCGKFLDDKEAPRHLCYPCLVCGMRFDMGDMIVVHCCYKDSGYGINFVCNKCPVTSLGCSVDKFKQRCEATKKHLEAGEPC